MRIEIDQSGKIEDTNRPTVISYSNSKMKTLIILSKDKKLIQKLFRQAGRPKIFVYRTFAVLIFLLLKDDIKNKDQIIIDKEYIGYEKLIKRFILELCQKFDLKIEPDSIHFKEIGKKSNAHKIAINSYRTKKGDIKITLNDYLRVNL